MPDLVLSGLWRSIAFLHIIYAIRFNADSVGRSVNSATVTWLIRCKTTIFSEPVLKCNSPNIFSYIPLDFYTECMFRRSVSQFWDHNLTSSLHNIGFYNLVSICNSLKLLSTLLLVLYTTTAIYTNHVPNYCKHVIFGQVLSVINTQNLQNYYAQFSHYLLAFLCFYISIIMQLRAVSFHCRNLDCLLHLLRTSPRSFFTNGS